MAARAGETRTRSGAGRSLALSLLGLALLAAGCSTTAGVNRVGLRGAYRDISVSSLNEREASEDSKVVLHRYDLVERFDKDPEGALAFLREKALREDDRRDLRFAIAELSFLYADHLLESVDPEEHRRAPDYFLQAALAAYSYLLGPSRESPPRSFDRRFRLACDLYNRALGKGLVTGSGGQVNVHGGAFQLPAGSLSVSLDTRALPWPLESFESFYLADDFSVRGFTLRNRTPGLGVPLVAVQKRPAGAKKGIAVPVTAFLRFLPAERSGGLPSFSGTLELHSAYDETEVEVNGRKIPLETDSTAPLAYSLEDPFVWNAGVKRFLKVEERIEPGTQLFQPYLPGRIPVVFVHGTASSPVWWAEMINTLRGDSYLRGRYQYWYFQYNSNGPITVSAWALRDSLTKLVRQLDPEGKDPALRQMVVIGHSQGGLLTKMAAVHTGDRLWRSISDESLEDAKLAPPLKEKVQEYLFIEPLPFVKRVVFISTPHRGSYRTYGWVRSLVSKLVSLPADLTGTFTELLASG
ncbi:MAG: alpha/beta fold hydrolase, partial [Deltaproteobacteria bacterium]|nr:alpha/beta fold hydrolase [Deltaproteobacteria bacterium]